MKMRFFSDEERPNHPPKKGRNEDDLPEEEIQQVDYERYIHEDYFSIEEIPNQVDYERFIHEGYFSDEEMYTKESSFNGGTIRRQSSTWRKKYSKEVMRGTTLCFIMKNLGTLCLVLKEVEGGTTKSQRTLPRKDVIRVVKPLGHAGKTLVTLDRKRKTYEWSITAERMEGTTEITTIPLFSSQ